MAAMAERRYFGTDGVRGVAGEHPMTGAFAFRLGVAAAEGLRRRGRERPKVVVGMDTRRSGPMLAHAVSAGLASRGADVTWLGVIPTPGVSYLARKLGCDAGVVVSASHNPFDDNGLKLFNQDGEKLSDALEEEIEALLDVAPEALPPVTGNAVGSATRYRTADGHYMQHLLSNAPYLDGLRVALDCANGAASQIAPKVFEKIGARLDVIHARPDGENINVGCGSTDPVSVRSRVVDHELDVGVTFDGDADRALLVDRKGRLVTGDHIMAICALTSGDEEVVATLMSNLGVERFLQARGVRMHRVQVGDRYVLEALRESGGIIGGETSGHMICLDRTTTGDGLISALQILAVMKETGRSLSELAAGMPKYPQKMLNVRLSRKMDPQSSSAIRDAVSKAEVELRDAGRVVLRASGTEPVIRVMVEGQDERQVLALAERLAEVVAAAAA